MQLLLSAFQIPFVFSPQDKRLCWGTYTKYVRGGGGGGGWRVFEGTMKYFRHVLMGHEIFVKIFDGLRSIFRCSIFIILFFKIKLLKHKERDGMLNKSHPLSRHKANTRKN